MYMYVHVRTCLHYLVNTVQVSVLGTFQLFPVPGIHIWIFSLETCVNEQKTSMK